MKAILKNARWAIALAIGLIVSLALSSFNVFAEECDDIRHDVLRLHILANSDSEEDQALKLAVRDRILELDSELFSSAANLADAKATVQDSLSLIQQQAEAEISSRGFSYPVNVELTNMYFSTREYDAFTLPAGKYDAVRITIGEAQGKNWWCVLYPPLCIPAASSKEEFLEMFSNEQAEILKNKAKYEYKFAAVELFEKLKEALNQLGG